MPVSEKECVTFDDALNFRELRRRSRPRFFLTFSPSATSWTRTQSRASPPGPQSPWASSCIQARGQSFAVP